MYRNITILIVEDEVLIAQDLKEILEEVGYNKVLKAKNIQEALEKLHENKIGLVLLDINFRGAKTGIDLAVMLNDEFHIPFIFITSYSDDDTISSVKKTNPSGFLLKPFNKDLLLITLELALYKNTSEEYSEEKEIDSEYMHGEEVNVVINKYFVIKDNFYFIKILLEEILWFESDKNYIQIVTLDKSHTIRSSLKKLEEELPSDLFIKCHKKYIVNINHIKSFNSSSVLIKNKSIPVSRNQKSEVYKAIKNADYI